MKCCSKTFGDFITDPTKAYAFKNLRYVSKFILTTTFWSGNGPLNDSLSFFFVSDVASVVEPIEADLDCRDRVLLAILPDTCEFPSSSV